MAVGRGGVLFALAACALAHAAIARVSSADPAHSLEGFRDAGEAPSLLKALRLARSGMGVDDARRRLVDALIADVSTGQPVEVAIRAHGRPRETVEVLLTGYYEPLLRARQKRGGPFQHPLYRMPEGVHEGRESRKAIDEGALAEKGLEIFWLDDPIESFFLHVQGSGRLDLGGGRLARVGYAGNNGHAYHSIGSELVSGGDLTREQATAPAIKKWLRDHPGRATEVLHTNPRYIFFRELDLRLEQGPLGAMGVALVPFRSVATDREVAPPGTVGLLTAEMPDGSKLSRVVVAMDAGAAIQGPSRIDLFVGAGASAERFAGELRARGRVVWFD